MYERAADLAGVTWCPREECAFIGALQHGTVHFARVRYTKAGLYHFLWLAWRSTHQDPLDMERWEYDFACYKWIQTTAGELGVRLPRSLFELDRATLREALSQYAHRVPHYARPARYKEAKQWAKER
jgi:hypothetical protein